ncbi:MAG: hypothetical protein U5M50_06745 [Sphingobium sp.]|nr:hypothetical protein [Sphingobium sp.]
MALRTRPHDTPTGASRTPIFRRSESNDEPATEAICSTGTHGNRPTATGIRPVDEHRLCARQPEFAWVGNGRPTGEDGNTPAQHMNLISKEDASRSRRYLAGTNCACAM